MKNSVFIKLIVIGMVILFIATSFGNSISQNSSLTYYRCDKNGMFQSFLNQPPVISTPDPSDGEDNVPVTIDQLSVFIYDADGDSFDWWISTEPDIGNSAAFDDKDGTKICNISDLEYSTTYTWTVTATDAGGLSTFETYTFKTEPNLPPTISCPDPSDGENNVPVTISQLSVFIYDSNDDSFDWWISTEPDIGNSAAFDDKDGTKICNISDLEYSTTYTWTVTATDAGGLSTFETYTFKTEPNAPPIISNEFPYDGSYNISIYTDQLSVFIYDPDGDSFDWWISTEPDIGNSAAFNDKDGTKICNISDLEYRTPYTWTVTAYNIGGQSTSVTFSFTTESSGDDPPIIYYERPKDGSSASNSTTELSVYIADPEGGSFDWSIATNPDIGNISTSSDFNGIKTCPINGELEYGQPYRWFVTATDGDGNGNTTNATFTFTINHPPELFRLNGWPDGVDPDFDYPGAVFDFKVHYFDEDGDEPIVKKLYIIDPNNHTRQYNMDGSGYNNVYSYSKEFALKGNYSYYMYFEDGIDYGRLPLDDDDYWPFRVIDNASKPSWEEDDSWWYTIHDLEIDIGNGFLIANPCNFYIEVAKNTSSTYKLNYAVQDVTGKIGIKIKDFDVSGNLEDGEINGYLLLDKSDIGIKKFEFNANGLIKKSPRNWDIDIKIIFEYKNSGAYNFFFWPIVEDEEWNVSAATFDGSVVVWVKPNPGKWNKIHDKSKPHNLVKHNVECIGIEDFGEEEIQVFHVIGFVDYWYSPVRETLVKVEGDLFGMASLNATLDYCAPNKPDRPSGKTNVKVGETCEYSTSTVDPNGDRFQYGWDWDGDKKVDEDDWTEKLYKSGEICNVKHMWTREELRFGNAKIFVKARDIYGEVSVWSDPLIIPKPRYSTINPYYHFFKIFSKFFPMLDFMNFFKINMR